MSGMLFLLSIYVLGKYPVSVGGHVIVLFGYSLYQSNPQISLCAYPCAFSFGARYQQRSIGCFNSVTSFSNGYGYTV